MGSLICWQISVWTSSFSRFDLWTGRRNIYSSSWVVNFLGFFKKVRLLKWLYFTVVHIYPGVIPGTKDLNYIFRSQGRIARLSSPNFLIYMGIFSWLTFIYIFASIQIQSNFDCICIFKNNFDILYHILTALGVYIWPRKKAVHSVLLYTFLFVWSGFSPMFFGLRAILMFSAFFLGLTFESCRPDTL